MKNDKQKRVYELFVFNFCDFKLVPSDSALNSASDNLTVFFQKVGRKAVKPENPA